jgi:vacuolar-type H+-ATPase subunit H
MAQWLIKWRAVMANPVSPLEAIYQKEMELRRRVDEARTQAEAEVRAAREEAERAIAQADREGRAEADTSYQSAIEQARQEAGAIVTAARDDALELRRRATARLDDVAAQIAEMVLAQPVENPMNNPG